MTQLANQFELYISKGSDFHSPENIYRELGQMQAVPPGSVPLWRSTEWKERIGAIS